VLDGDNGHTFRIPLGFGHSIGIARLAWPFGDRAEHDLYPIGVDVYERRLKRYEPPIYIKVFDLSQALYFQKHLFLARRGFVQNNIVRTQKRTVFLSVAGDWQADVYSAGGPFVDKRMSMRFPSTTFKHNKEKEQ